MKRRIHSSLQPAHRTHDFTEFLTVKSKLIASSCRTDASDAVLEKKHVRSNSMAPSSLHSSPNFLRMVGYSPQRIRPVVRFKTTTFISNKTFYQQPQQKFSKTNIWNFSKFDEHAGKICRSCEEQQRYKPKLFKRRK